MVPEEKLPTDDVPESEERRFWEENDSSDFIDWSQAVSVTLPNLVGDQRWRYRSDRS